jgi:hypothetical protein
MTDIFQQIKIAEDLEEAARLTLRDWFPVYLREIEVQSPAEPDPRHIPSDSLPMPNSFLTAEKLDKEAADQLPAVVVVSPGLSGKNPKQEGDGSFRCFFNIGVGVFVESNDRPHTKRLVRLYTAIARSIMLQKQSLGGYANGTTWLDESYDDNFSFTDRQTIGVGQVVLEVEVAGVVNRYGGPAVYGGPPPAPDPVTQPGATWPEVETTSATVEVKE